MQSLVGNFFRKFLRGIFVFLTASVRLCLFLTPDLLSKKHIKFCQGLDVLIICLGNREKHEDTPKKQHNNRRTRIIWEKKQWSTVNNPLFLIEYLLIKQKVLCPSPPFSTPALPTSVPGPCACIWAQAVSQRSRLVFQTCVLNVFVAAFLAVA